MSFLDGAFDNGFLGKLKETLQDTGWFVGAPIAAAFDMARAGLGQSDENVGQIVSKAFNRGTQLFFGDTQGTDNEADDKHNLLDPAIGKAMDGLEWVYDNAIAQPINALNVVQQRGIADIRGIEDNASPFDLASAWRRGDETTGGYDGKGTSIGREWAYTLAGIKGDGSALTNEGQRELDQHNKVFDVQSGAIDATSRFYLDPTIVLGKASKVLLGAKAVGAIGKPAEIAENLAKEGDGLFAGWGTRHNAAVNFIVEPRADGNARSAGEIYSAFDGLRDTQDGMLIAQLMESTVKDMRTGGATSADIAEQIALISRAGMGDAGALKQMNDKASAAKDALANWNSERDDLAKATEYALARNGRPVGYVSPYAGGDGLQAAQTVAGRYKFVDDVKSRGIDYYSSDEFLSLADARMNAVRGNFRAAETEAKRLQRVATLFTGDDSALGVLADKPLLAALRGASTKGLEKRANKFTGYKEPARLDFVFQSSAFNYAVKLTMPHIYLAHKAYKLFNTPAQPRLLEFHDPHIALGLNAFLRHSEINPNIREGLVSEIAGARDEGAMRAVVTKAVVAAQESMIDAYKKKNPRFTDETADIVKHEMAKQIAWERDRVANQVRKFTAHKNEDGSPGDVRFDPETGMPSYHALLETQLENRMILPDLKAFDRVLSRHANTLTDMAEWAKGNRLPDQGRVKEIAARVFDHKVGDSTVGQKLAPVATNVNLATWKTDRFITDALSRFNTAWKFAALLRPAYPMRVLVDSDLRVLSRVGPASFAMHVMPRAFGFATVGGASRMKQLFAQRLDDDNLRAIEVRMEQFEDAWKATNDGPIEDDVYKQLAQDAKTIRERQAIASTGRKGRREAYGTFGDAGQKSIKTAAGEIPGAFTDSYGRMRRWQYSSETTANLIGDSNKLAMRNLLTDQWVSLDHTAPNHLDSWLHAVNAQILQSDLGKKALELQLKHGDDPAKAAEDLKRWAKGTPEGRKLMDRLMWTGAPSDHAASVVGMVNHYIPTRELRKAAAERRLKQEDLEAAFPDPTMRPPVHGQALAMAVGRGSYSARAANDFMTRTMRWLSDAPEDQLARHPLYAAVYEQEAKRRAEFLLADPNITHVTGADIQKLVQSQAHKAAGQAVKQTMFDIASRSDLSEAMRFVSPFIAAWEDTVRKWGRIAADNPDILGKAYAAWNIPNGMGLVVDEDGKPVDRDGFTDKDYVLVQWPSWVPKVGGKKVDLLPGSLEKWTGGRVSAEGTDFRIPKQSLNIVLQGGLQPGFGPIVAYPVSKLQMAQPDLNDVAELVNPFGPQTLFGSIAPATLKRLQENVDTQSRAHLYDTERLFMQMQAEYRIDPEKYGSAPTWEEAARRANAVGRLKILNNFANPFPATFDSKYKLYMDAYRDLKNQEREGNFEQGWADDQFIKGYGESFFPLVQSMSKNNARLDPTAEAVDAARKFSKEIDKYGMENGEPNGALIRLIVGPEGEGEYNESAHRWQESREISAGSGQNFRSVENPQEAAAQADVNLGHYKYRAFMNNLNATANSAGLKTYQDDPELVETRNQFLENLKEELPAWRVDWEQMDTGKFTRNIEKLAEFAKSSKYGADRTDMAGVREYLALRQALKDQLDEYGVSEGSQDAQPLRQEFTEAVMDLVSQNTSFSEWAFHGFLERDPLLEPQTVAQFAAPPVGMTSEWGF